MPRQFSATILMQRPWPLDVDALASHVRARFPQIGLVEAMPGQVPNREAGLLTIDGGKVVIMCIPSPLPKEALFAPLKTLRVWEPEPAIAKHYAHIIVSCGGDLPGVDGAKAYAAAVHFVAAAIAEMAPSVAAFWSTGWALSQPEDFIAATDTILDGRAPLGAWVSYATIVPRGFASSEATGIVSYGLKHFLGRELELAPAPIDGKTAYRRVSAIAKAVMDRGAKLHDGQQLVDPDRTFAMLVRERNYWLRRDQSAYVLIGEDSVIDAETLRPAERAVA